MLRIIGILLVALGIALPAAADSIIVDGQTLDNVYIIETGSMYYVHFPETGKATGIAKAGVPRDAVRITPDPAARKSLRDQWNASSELLRPKPAQSITTEVPAKQQAPRKSDVPRHYLKAPDGQYVTGGVVPHVKLEGVPLGRGLKAILRPMNLNYKVEDGYLWISSPEKLRTESMEDPETRIYSLKNAGAETLPKVLVNNTAGAAQAAPIGGGNNFGGGIGGVGTTGFGGGVGGVGSGFGGGMGMGTAPTFSNISQLFGTIDDRSVGESPAVIEMGNVTLQGNENANYAAHNGLRSTQEPLRP